MYCLLGHSRFRGVALSDAFVDLVKDATIGPEAPGDGDLFTWYCHLTNLCLFRLVHMTDFEMEQVRSWKVAELKSSRPSQIEEMFRWIRDSYWIDGFSESYRTKERSDAWQKISVAMDLFALEAWGSRESATARIPKKPKTRNAHELLELGVKAGLPVRQLQRLTGFSQATIYRRLNRRG